MGTEGAIISVLMGTVPILCGVIVIMYNRANKIYGYRLRERDVLNTALSAATAATREHTQAMESRSAAMTALADAIRDQSATFEQLRDRVQMQHEFVSRELDRQAESHRELLSASMRDHHNLESIAAGVVEMREKITRVRKPVPRTRK